MRADASDPHDLGRELGVGLRVLPGGGVGLAEVVEEEAEEDVRQEKEQAQEHDPRCGSPLGTCQPLGSCAPCRPMSNASVSEIVRTFLSQRGVELPENACLELTELVLDAAAVPAYVEPELTKPMSEDLLANAIAASRLIA